MNRPSPALMVAPLVLLLGGAFPTSAPAAATYPYGVELAATSRRQGTVSVAGAKWSCKGARCASSSTSTHPTVDACHALALQVGPVRSYGRKGLMLTRDELRECNAGIPAAETAGASSADRRIRSVTPDDFVPLAAPLPGEPQKAKASPHPVPSAAVTTPTGLPPPARPVLIDAGTLHYAGSGSVLVDAGTLRYAGNESVLIDAGTLAYPARSP